MEVIHVKSDVELVVRPLITVKIQIQSYNNQFISDIHTIVRHPYLSVASI